jgi:hypothetical protein
MGWERGLERVMRIGVDGLGGFVGQDMTVVGCGFFRCRRHSCSFVLGLRWKQSFGMGAMNRWRGGYMPSKAAEGWKARRLDRCRTEIR